MPLKAPWNTEKKNPPLDRNIHQQAPTPTDVPNISHTEMWDTFTRKGSAVYANRRMFRFYLEL